MTATPDAPARPTSRAGAPDCDPATLGAPCHDCNRRLHAPGSKPRICDAGHPPHHSEGRCDTCYRRHLRRPAAVVHPYCPHDEGEECTCAVELRAHVPAGERRRTRRAPTAPGVKSSAEQFAAICVAVDALTAQGMTIPAIAAQLGVSARTVSRARSRRAP